MGSLSQVFHNFSDPSPRVHRPVRRISDLDDTWSPPPGSVPHPCRQLHTLPEAVSQICIDQLPNTLHSSHPDSTLTCVNSFGDLSTRTPCDWNVWSTLNGQVLQIFDHQTWWIQSSLTVVDLRAFANWSLTTLVSVPTMTTCNYSLLLVYW